ncbi:MAG TPA: phosphoserine phosphatase SerB [Casimicrobiaceae bacterium]|nr:phosphoserine phosphatase SerB [Casimicrobiaceae bacterium]
MSGSDVVVQGPGATLDVALALAPLARASDAEALSRTSTPAFRLVDGVLDDAVAAAARAERLDVATVPRDRVLADVGVVAMDMDSTLITIECIDEIADMLGIKPQVAAITEAAMRGELDFRASLTRRVALLAGLPVEALQRVYDERLRVTPGAETMLAGFHAVGATSLLVSGGFTFFTDRLMARVGLHATLSNVLGIEDDRLTGRVVGDIVDARAKAQALRDVHAGRGGLAVAIGDGANDLPMFGMADVSIAFRAKPVVRAQATHAIDFCGLDAVLNLFA